MRYEDFRMAIQQELGVERDGLTWVEIRERCGLPYERPCPTWTKRLEEEIGLTRSRASGSGRALIWRVRGQRCRAG
jgi:hypothetical protein